MTSNGIIIPPGHHQRENSAGLDILSAAANGMPQEELAAAAGGRETMHTRDLSLASSAFGSLGSVDFKRWMNSISPQPESQRPLNMTVTMSSNPPHQVQVHEQKRSATPPTPMISNVDRYSAIKVTAMNPPLPQLTAKDAQRRPRESLKPIFVPPEMKRDLSTSSTPPTDNTVESGQKMPTHQLSFSGYLNTMVAPVPHHTREPSETSKMLIHLEQRIDQDAIHAAVHHPSVYDAAQHQPSGEARVGQMVFPSNVAAACVPPEQQTPAVAHAQQMYPMPAAATYAPPPVAPVASTSTSTSLSEILSPVIQPRSSAGDTPVLPPVWNNTFNQPSAPPVYCMPAVASETRPNCESPASSTEQMLAGGKRVRRKCSVGDCKNRVVQGGLCISHGARRKQCAHSGCTKNVKKAGLCSAHGPARKRCDEPGCDKVSVQGGKCITHGARKKLCSVDGCIKQGIINGHCKKHYDQLTGKKPASSAKASKTASSSPKGKRAKVSVGVTDDSAAKEELRAPTGSSHRRGLSIFHDMKAMEEFIACDETITSRASACLPMDSTQPLTRTDRVAEDGAVSASVSAVTFSASEPRSSLLDASSAQLHKRGLSLFGDENVSDAIISGALISSGP